MRRGREEERRRDRRDKEREYRSQVEWRRGGGRGGAEGRRGEEERSKGER